jgi:hypothetical protein
VAELSHLTPAYRIFLAQLKDVQMEKKSSKVALPSLTHSLSKMFMESIIKLLLVEIKARQK